TVRLNDALRLVVVALVVGALASVDSVRAQTPGAGTLQGLATTQTGSVRLPGVEVVIKDQRGTPVATLVTEGDGGFRVPGLVPGKYVVTASLNGFVTTAGTVEVKADGTAELALDLPIAGISQSVEVVAPTLIVSQEGTLAPSETL